MITLGGFGSCHDLAPVSHDHCHDPDQSTFLVRTECPALSPIARALHGSQTVTTGEVPVIGLRDAIA